MENQQQQHIDDGGMKTILKYVTAGIRIFKDVHFVAFSGRSFSVACSNKARGMGQSMWLVFVFMI